MDTSKKPAGLGKPCLLIIVVASVERFAYKGVASNLVTFLTDELKMSTSAAAKSFNSWYGVTAMLPLLGAFIADSYLGRYTMILCSSLLYVLGLGALTFWAMLCAWAPPKSLFFPLYLISVAQGGYNPSLQAFGADQLEDDDKQLISTIPEEQESNNGDDKKLFFQWWYFGICSGSLLGNFLTSFIQDNYGWGLGFAITTIAMGLSVGCFAIGSRCYIHKQKKVTTITSPVTGIMRAIKTIIRHKVTDKIKLPAKETEVTELKLQKKPLRINDTDDLEQLEQNSNMGSNQQSVTKVILRLLPIWILLLIFAVIFQLPSTLFTNQGMSMRHNIRRNFKVPPATLQSAITITVIMFMPIYDRIIIPFIRYLTHNKKGIDVFRRIAIGMLLSIFAMVVAALVEIRRVRFTKNVMVSSRDSISEQLSIFWLLPQYILLGISDVFTVVGMQEFFYTQVPSTMRSIGIALYFSVFGVGSLLGAFLITAIEFVTSQRGSISHGWFSDDMREAQLYKYYWFLALLSSISFSMFLYLHKYYVSHD